ncbi:Lysocardiolipin acyltransferase [Ectocarpus siliculosus]|uniref:Lysocardiolipin acyltransferase n=1 Tax=Ectocarpus siliculosus TaxID=2880 RepID=D7G331_ECTSI|nr:Lysocardiolipin acyltransferase [Ectocarpus siliculosus]|eukprot:CBJ33474.1 Lysocardiolipin acyltransferase [Ectocarpus siliculosus]
MVASARGFVFVAVLFVSSLLYSVTLLTPALLLLIPISPPGVYLFFRRAYRRWSGFVGYLFFAMAAFLLENLCGIKVKITGDRLEFGEAALIICNHRTRVDWMFLWCLCLRQGQLSSLKIVLKESLKGIPGFGWATQMLLFVFLKRDKTKDLQRVREISDYLVGLDMPTTLLLFPEGTDLSPNNHLKSLAFAKKEGLAEYQYVLHPKVRGFSECMQALRPGLDAVHDVTIAYHNYKDGGPPSENTMLAGCFPPEVHMHVTRFAVADLPTDDDGLQQWCREAFTEKEERLREFHQGPRSFDQAGRLDEHGDDDEASRSGLLALVFFVAFFLLVALYGGKVFYAGAASACCLCTLVTSLGGFDTLELRWSRFSFGTSSGELKQD